MEDLDRFRGRLHIRTFICGIFYHKVSELLREKEKGQENDPIDEVMQSKFDAKRNWRHPPADIEKQVLAQERGEIILDCLEAIAEGHRKYRCKKSARFSTHVDDRVFSLRNPSRRKGESRRDLR